MTETPDVAAAPEVSRIQFYDSIKPDEIPGSAEYAALYADGEFRVPSLTDVARFTHRRWITVTGELHHVGIADFEYPNPVFTDPERLFTWAVQRMTRYNVPGIIYSDMSDVHRAITAVRDTQVIYWIATRELGELTPIELCARLHVEFGVTLTPDDLWAQQYANVDGKYDVSQLFGKWYH